MQTLIDHLNRDHLIIDTLELCDFPAEGSVHNTHTFNRALSRLSELKRFVFVQNDPTRMHVDEATLRTLQESCPHLSEIIISGIRVRRENNHPHFFARFFPSAKTFRLSNVIVYDE